MTVSIIIAVKAWQKNLEECVNRCRQLDCADFEILILPDEAVMKPQEDLVVIPTGFLSPAEKRDIGLKRARGEFIAFIDDDAYPVRDWLKNALANFKDPETAAVGGPAVTALSDNLRQKASGLVYACKIVSAGAVQRYAPKQRRQANDLPSCNFIVRRSILEELGGFNTVFWPGEDTKLCFDITKKLGKKIIYDPEVLVYHHRRPLFMPHLRQAASYALHRGYFVKRFPQTSCRGAYFIPSLFLVSLLTGVFLSLFFPLFKAAYLAGISLYLLLVFLSSISKPPGLIPLVFFGIITTHITYGFYFLKGLFSVRLREEL